MDTEVFVGSNNNSPVIATYMTNEECIPLGIDKGGGQSFLWRLDPVEYDANSG